jgi:hypothetical protein
MKEKSVFRIRSALVNSCICQSRYTITVGGFSDPIIPLKAASNLRNSTLNLNVKNVQVQ